MAWTLCSEKIPQGSEIVLVTVPEYVDEDGIEYCAGVCCAYVIETAASGVMWFRSDGVTYGELGRLRPNPVAWMPKPEPYIG